LLATNTLAYYENSQLTGVKSFITLGPGDAGRLQRQEDDGGWSRKKDQFRRRQHCRRGRRGRTGPDRRQKSGLQTEGKRGGRESQVAVS
jgi:hypothetical protein